VQAKLVESAGKKERVLAFPRVQMLEGNRASVAVSGSTGQVMRQLGLEVIPRKADQVLLDLSLEEKQVTRSGEEGDRVRSACLETVRGLRLGQTTKLVLDKDCAGKPKSWADVTVFEAGKDKGSDRPASER